MYYIGKIISLQDADFVVKFLRKKANNSFQFPDVDDISVIAKKDIAAVLPTPISKGTSRTSNVFKFNVNFSFLNVR